MTMVDWFVSADGNTTGPHPAEHVRHWVTTGQIPPSSLFWPDGGTAWQSLEASWPALGGTGPVPGTLPPGTVPDGVPGTGIPGALPPRTVGQPGGDPIRGGVLAFTDRLADFAGVERLEGFRPQDLVSAVFRKYGREEIERHFATGLPGYTPDLQAIESGWPKPWMFIRMLGASVLVFAGFWLLVSVFQSTNMLPGMLLVGSFAVPLSTLVFFLEVNSPRNVSLYLVIHCLVIGGLISLALTLVLEQTTGHLGPAGNFVDPFLIGFSEEVAKLVAVLVITMRLPAQRYPWILNGMLFGAAVGAGFACFESAGYALGALFSGGADVVQLGYATHLIIIRGLLAPFGHVVWTALAAGALWRVKLDGRLAPGMLVHQRVIRILVVVILLHAIWDFPFTDRVPFLIIYLLLGLVAWFIAFGMLQGGLKQIKAAQLSGQQGHAQVSGNTTVLRSIGSIGP
jgi:RsiW-degrading membrane proteinase PrsW (M82 family)